MNCAGDSNCNDPVFDTFNNDDIQSSLEMYEMYSPDKNKANIPFIKNPVIGLVEAVSDSVSYAGPKNLTMGNFYYNQGRYERAIEIYVLNVLPERYTLTTDIKESFIGLARCYLKLGDLPSSINNLHKAFTVKNNGDGMTITHQELFLEISYKIKEQFAKELAALDNSLDLYEFVGELLEDKSGWELALRIVEFITGNN
ncbi:MAG: tetratricopeptide repeat protein [Candidatus Heimdallarchaeota archaeon]|nr:tetratricopeptide repeat protein [Candidatus Heimdallarchaeota archaeon]